MKWPLPIFACVCLAGLSAVPACVTETVTPMTRRFTGVPVSPGKAPVNSSGGANSPGAAAPVALPNGPIATPATTSKTTSSEVQVGVVPMGVILYDGQALPLVSPDGHFIAIQEGEAPTWEAILAEPAAGAPTGSALAVYEIGEHELKRVPPAQDLPGGLILGRAADDRGFLVEAPQADGSRWIGRVAWSGGTGVQWLVRGPLVCSHAIFTSRGELVYTSRAVEKDACDLVIRGLRGDQTVRTPGDGRYAFPMCTQDPDMVYVFHLTPATMEVEAIKLDRGSEGAEGVRVPSFGATAARKGVAPKGDMTIAFQMASTVQPALPLEKGTTAAPDTGLAILHPRMGRMAQFNVDTGTFEPLATKSFASIPSLDPDRPGVFCATPTGLVFSPPYKAGAEETTVRVVTGQFVPRRIRGMPQSIMLFGLVKNRTDQYQVVKLVVGPPQAAPAPKN